MDFIRESIPIEEGIKHTKIIQRRLKIIICIKLEFYKTELACMSNVSSSTTHKPVADYDSESASTHKLDYESASIGNTFDKTVYHIKKDVDKPDYKTGCTLNVKSISKTTTTSTLNSNQKHFI